MTSVTPTRFQARTLTSDNEMTEFEMERVQKLQDKEETENEACVANRSIQFRTILKMLQAEHEKLLAENENHKQRIALLTSASSAVPHMQTDVDGDNDEQCNRVDELSDFRHEDPPASSVSKRSYTDSFLPGMAQTMTIDEDKNDSNRINSKSITKRSYFESLPVWLEELQTGLMVSQCAPSGIVLDKDGDMKCAKAQHNGFVQHFISYPNSPKRVAWDFFGAFLIVYDLISIPLTLSFEPPPTAFTLAMDWGTLIFWTANVLASFQVGYVENGQAVLAPAKIAIRYIKTWLLVDLLVVIPDWAFKIVDTDGSAGAGSSVKLLRSLRLMRMVRLLRLLKLRKIWQHVNDAIDSEYVSIIANIVKMILLLLVINHCIGCTWFLIADIQSAQTDTWVVVHGFEGTEWSYQYMTAFHWSITQFTPASMHVQPQNLSERVFAILVVVFALVCFSYVVGSITGSLTQLRTMQEDSTKQFWNLRRFMKQNKVSPLLSHRIQKYLEHSWQSNQVKLSVKSIKLFSLLSEQLHNELQFELSVPHLSVHPLFQRLTDVSNVTMHRVADMAISRKMLARNDALFISAETATHMFIVVDGRLQYCRMDNTFQEHKEWVDKGEDWIAEPVLWTHAWTHLGSLSAVTECDLLLVEPKKFCELVRLNPAAFQLAAGYAKKFLEWLNSIAQADLSDIWQGEEVGDLIDSFMVMEEERVATQPKHDWSLVSASFRRGRRPSVPVRSSYFERRVQRALSSFP